MPRADAPLFTRFYHGLRERSTPVGRVNLQKERAVEKTLPSTVTIVTQNPNGTAEIGSGFVVATSRTPGKPKEVLLVTNNHVINSYNTDTEGVLQLFVQTSGANRGVRDESLKQTFANAEVAHVSAKHDLALLRLSLAEHPEVDMPPLKLGYSSLLDTPDTLLSIGAPLGTEDTVTELHLSKDNLTQVQSEDGAVDLFMQISEVNAGNSGGAAIDPLFAGLLANPVVVGMLTLGAKDNPTQGYMLPVEVIREELALFQAKEQQASSRRLPFAA